MKLLTHVFYMFAVYQEEITPCHLIPSRRSTMCLSSTPG